MPSEQLPDTPSPLREGLGSATPSDGVSDPGPSDGDEHPVNLSEFSQRLASFGLGEAPDPLLTEARPPTKRRSRT